MGIGEDSCLTGRGLTGLAGGGDNRPPTAAVNEGRKGDLEGTCGLFTIDESSAVPEAWRGAYLAVGNFDGVHVGHAALVATLRRQADAAELPAVALTFDPHPLAILRPERSPVPLTWTSRTAGLLQEAGATDVGVFQTGPWLLGLSARDFFDQIVIGRFGARGMVEGPNFGFGRDRGGDAGLLESWCAGAGLGFEVVTPAEVNGRPVSSSRIRELLTAGEVAEAALLLGRPHRIRGEVVRGAGRGAGLGFPTANLAGVDTLIPADGVYAARAFLDGEAPPCPVALHIGPNATFGERLRSVEAHLIDYRGDLYGRTLELDLIARLRGSRAFAGVEDLLAQIAADVARAREVAASR